MADDGPPRTVHTWIGIESFDDLDTLRVENLVTAAVSGVEQRGGSIASVGLAPLSVPDNGVFILAWVVWHEMTP